MKTTEKKRILIVDDEEDLTWSISRGLLKDKNSIDVMCANSGINAFNLFSKNKFDLLVTDIRMPGGNGLSLLKKVKKQFPKTRIIVMTAYGSNEIKEILGRSMIYGYIEKPFEFKELRDLIFDCLNENSENKKAVKKNIK
jgi:DNA-binding NtrC family response regulator